MSSADFESAVSPIYNRQCIDLSQAIGLMKATQAESRAIQQIENLRYNAHLPIAIRCSRARKKSVPSHVSPIRNRQCIDLSQAIGLMKATQAESPAIQQIENLRYNAHLPIAIRCSRARKKSVPSHVSPI